MSGVVKVQCGQCPILHMVWWMSCVVDVCVVDVVQSLKNSLIWRKWKFFCLIIEKVKVILFWYCLVAQESARPSSFDQDQTFFARPIIKGWKGPFLNIQPSMLYTLYYICSLIYNVFFCITSYMNISPAFQHPLGLFKRYICASFWLKRPQECIVQWLKTEGSKSTSSLAPSSKSTQWPLQPSM